MVWRWAHARFTVLALAGGRGERQRTFWWMLVVLAGFCVREDLLGVTSIVRGLGLDPMGYDRLPDLGS